MIAPKPFLLSVADWYVTKKCDQDERSAIGLTRYPRVMNDTHEDVERNEEESDMEVIAPNKEWIIDIKSTMSMQT